MKENTEYLLPLIFPFLISLLGLSFEDYGEGYAAFIS